MDNIIVNSALWYAEQSSQFLANSGANKLLDKGYDYYVSEFIPLGHRLIQNGQIAANAMDGELAAQFSMAYVGNMYSTYDLALNAHRFSANGNLEFMAYLVDYKDTYNESYQFRTLFGGSISTEDGSFHSVRNGMTKALHEYLVKTTVLEPEYLEDPDRNKLAYVMAVGKYVYGEEDNKTEETFSGYFKRFDDTLTVEFLVNPSHWAESVVAELDKRTELYDGLNFSAGSGKDLIAVQRLVEQ